MELKKIVSSLSDLNPLAKEVLSTFYDYTFLPFLLKWELEKLLLLNT